MKETQVLHNSKIISEDLPSSKNTKLERMIDDTCYVISISDTCSLKDHCTSFFRFKYGVEF